MECCKRTTAQSVANRLIHATWHRKHNSLRFLEGDQKQAQKAVGVKETDNDSVVVDVQGQQVVLAWSQRQRERATDTVITSRAQSQRVSGGPVRQQDTSGPLCGHRQ